MTPRFHRLDIAELRRETPDAVSIAFAVPEKLRDAYRFAAGQHVTVKTRIAGEEIRRSYSICAGIDDGELRIAIKKQPHGVFSRFANERLAAGDALEVMTPSGHFTLPRDAGTRTYLGLACGAGITPMLSLVKTALAREPASRFFLLYGNRTTQSILFRQELEDLKDRFMGRLSLTHVLSREAQDVPFMSGRIDAEKIALYLQRVVPAATVDVAFICGPPAMLETAKQTMLAAGLAHERIRIERFTPDGALIPAPAPAKPTELAAPSDGIASADAILDGVRRHFPIAEGQTVIDAALAAGIELPYSCRGGMCCTCRAKLLAGQVAMDVNYSLEPWELAAGYVLTCQSRPQSKTVVLDYDHL